MSKKNSSKSKKARKTELTVETAKKLTGLDAAAKVLADAGEPLNAKQIVERMASSGLWTSPVGKTPHATVYAAMVRSMNKDGNASRFKKATRGKFTVAS